MLTKQKLDELAKLAKGNELLEEAYKEIISIYDDPTKMFYKELVQTVNALSVELSYIRNGQKELSHIIASEDKIFERVTKLATDADKIFSGLRKGKEDIDPDSVKDEKEKEKEVGLSYADKVANKKRKNHE